MNPIAAIERKIVRRLCREAIKDGFLPTVTFDGEEYVPTTTETAVLETVFSVDESTVSFRKNGKTHGVLLILGNDGWDVINDYHSDSGPFDAMMERVNTYAETLDEA